LTAVLLAFIEGFEEVELQNVVFWWSICGGMCGERGA
jgi:hypothetical protein